MHMNMMVAKRKYFLKMNEKKFKKWYSNWAKKTGINQNPDDYLQYYDYRAAYKENVTPKLADDGLYHWPSKYKHDLHPNRYIKDSGVWYDTKKEKVANFEDVLIQKWKRREYEIKMRMR